MLKYNECYVEYGLTFLRENDINLLQCIICFMLLANGSLKSDKLLRHLDINHVQRK